MADFYKDIVIVGAGISGLCAAVHFKKNLPQKDAIILEGRDSFGGTWDLFRYPGIRSDSDMATLGFKFKPWRKSSFLADGPSIMEYLRETIEEYDLQSLIKCKQHVNAADWNPQTGRWTLNVKNKDSGKTDHYHARFVYMCGGYYSYDNPHRPSFAGEADFAGTIIHPQLWDEKLDYKDKRVVVIGSGATAATLVPAMAHEAAHVTMLQRSPTYYAKVPDKDMFAALAQKLFPARMAFRIVRMRNIFRQYVLYRYCRNNPEKAKERLLDEVREDLPNFDVGKHFTPSYYPWEERLCALPDGDLFEAIRENRASIVTDHIEHFDAEGIKLKSGQHLPADIIITATGLNLQNFGGVKLSKQGKEINPADATTYRSMMYSGIPNFANCFGYINASWTLKSDITAEYICRLLAFMDKKHYDIVEPHIAEAHKTSESFLMDWSSGYIARAQDTLPRQGTQDPWRNNQHYLYDRFILGRKSVDDGHLHFATADESDTAQVAAE